MSHVRPPRPVSTMRTGTGGGSIPDSRHSPGRPRTARSAIVRSAGAGGASSGRPRARRTSSAWVHSSKARTTNSDPSFIGIAVHGDRAARAAPCRHRACERDRAVGHGCPLGRGDRRGRPRTDRRPGRCGRAPAPARPGPATPAARSRGARRRGGGGRGARSSSRTRRRGPLHSARLHGRQLLGERLDLAGEHLDRRPRQIGQRVDRAASPGPSTARARGAPPAVALPWARPSSRRRRRARRGAREVGVAVEVRRRRRPARRRRPPPAPTRRAARRCRFDDGSRPSHRSLRGEQARQARQPESQTRLRRSLGDPQPHRDLAVGQSVEVARARWRAAAPVAARSAPVAPARPRRGRRRPPRCPAASPARPTPPAPRAPIDARAGAWRRWRADRATVASHVRNDPRSGS